MRKRIFWVDTGERIFHELDPGTGAHRTFDSRYLLQAVGRRAAVGWIAIDQKGLAFWNHETGDSRFLGDPESGKPHMAMNGGAVGPDGRFYAGSMNVEVFDAQEGSVFRVDPDGSISAAIVGLAMPNGIAFSLDGRTMYVAEAFARRILAYDFDPNSGAPANRRVFADVPEKEGFPDGLIVDREGFLWSAHWQGFRITRCDPDGRRDRILEVPVPTATCMAFVGVWSRNSSDSTRFGPRSLTACGRSRM